VELFIKQAYRQDNWLIQFLENLSEQFDAFRGTIKLIRARTEENLRTHMRPGFDKAIAVKGLEFLTRIVRLEV
jgi:hypothetical protein